MVAQAFSYPCSELFCSCSGINDWNLSVGIPPFIRLVRTAFDAATITYFLLAGHALGENGGWTNLYGAEFCSSLQEALELVPVRGDQYAPSEFHPTELY